MKIKLPESSVFDYDTVINKWFFQVGRAKYGKGNSKEEALIDYIIKYREFEIEDEKA